jgi:hypothetical protein
LPSHLLKAWSVYLLLRSRNDDDTEPTWLFPRGFKKHLGRSVVPIPVRKGPKNSHRRMQREERTVEAMILIYCRSSHQGRELCPNCAELASYARSRLDDCPYMGNKPTCTNCQTHCYRPEMRARMRAVMRHSGPRMLVHHPILAIYHLLDGHRRTEARTILKERQP